MEYVTKVQRAFVGALLPRQHLAAQVMPFGVEGNSLPPLDELKSWLIPA